MRNGEAGPKAGPTRCTPIVNPATDPDKPTITVERSRLARWLEILEFALDATERERVDAILEAIDAIEDAWLSPEPAA